MRSPLTLLPLLALLIPAAASAVDMGAICRRQLNDEGATAVRTGDDANAWRCQTGVEVSLGCSGGEARNDTGRWDGWHCVGGTGLIVPHPPKARPTICEVGPSNRACIGGCGTLAIRVNGKIYRSVDYGAIEEPATRDKAMRMITEQCNRAVRDRVCTECRY